MKIVREFVLVGVCLSAVACGGTPYPTVFNEGFRPGAIVETYSKPVKTEMVCTQKESIGDAHIIGAAPLADGGAPCAVSELSGADVQESVLPDFTSETTSSAKGSLDAGIAAAIGAAKANGKRVSKISYTVKNLRQHSISLTAVNKGKRDPACGKTVDQRTAQGYKEDLVTQSFTGDIVYTIDTDSSVDVEAKVKLAEELAPTLGGSVSSTDKTKVEGKNVTWVAATTPFF